MTRQFASFDEFWPFYVREHSHVWTRRFHFVGTTLNNFCIAKFIASGRPRWLLFGALCGYTPAWISHFFIENNRPATFRHPLWSLIADYKMYGLMLTGRMDAEVARVLKLEEEAAAVDTPSSAPEAAVNTRVIFDA